MRTEVSGRGVVDLRGRHRERRVASESGFTLIELLVVVVIIGILIAIAIPVYLNYQRGARDKSADSDLRNAVAVLEQCNADNSSFPGAVVAGAGGLTAAATAPIGVACNGTVNASSGTTFVYTLLAGPPQSYKLTSTNSGGSTGRTYCYNSAVGGSIKAATTC